VRIVFVNSSCRREGGVETYLNTAISAFKLAGHEVAFCYEWDGASDRARISLPPGAPEWCFERLGKQVTASAVREWHPDLIYSHNADSVELQDELLKIAPAVFFAHAFYGTCISGTKAFKLPVDSPCDRRFGWQCLLHFFPRRCGGMNPLTMFSLYRTQAYRLESLKKYEAVITHSEYMRAEFIRHGIPADRVFSVPYSVKPLQTDVNPQAAKGKTPESSGFTE
jgi:hypothetical protein